MYFPTEKVSHYKTPPWYKYSDNHNMKKGDFHSPHRKHEVLNHLILISTAAWTFPEKVSMKRTKTRNYPNEYRETSGMSHPCENWNWHNIYHHKNSSHWPHRTLMHLPAISGQHLSDRPHFLKKCLYPARKFSLQHTNPHNHTSSPRKPWPHWQNACRKFWSKLNCSVKYNVYGQSSAYVPVLDKLLHHVHPETERKSPLSTNNLP